jgi:hypothetical protein
MTIKRRESLRAEMKQSREPNYKDGKYLPGFVQKCRCGFNWDDWVGNEYS